MSGTVIIGAGLIGASTAYALARRAEKVTILDMQDAPGKGAGYAETDHVKAFYKTARF